MLIVFIDHESLLAMQKELGVRLCFENDSGGLLNYIEVFIESEEDFGSWCRFYAWDVPA